MAFEVYNCQLERNMPNLGGAERTNVKNSVINYLNLNRVANGTVIKIIANDPRIPNWIEPVILTYVRSFEGHAEPYFNYMKLHGDEVGAGVSWNALNNVSTPEFEDEDWTPVWRNVYFQVVHVHGRIAYDPQERRYVGGSMVDERNLTRLNKGDAIGHLWGMCNVDNQSATEYVRHQLFHVEKGAGYRDLAEWIVKVVAVYVENDGPVEFATPFTLRCYFDGRNNHENDYLNDIMRGDVIPIQNLD